MGMHDFRSKETLGAMLETLDAIYQNTVSQGVALKRKDELLLKKLLDERQKLIGQIAGLSGKKSELCSSGDDEREDSVEKSIRLLLKDIERTNASNIRLAEKLKSEMAEKMSHIGTGKKAITKGYYQKMPALYGSFIDKRVGKSWL